MRMVFDLPVLPPLLHPARAARQEDDDGGQEVAHARHQDAPHADAEVGVAVEAAVVLVVDVGLDDPEADKVADEDDERHDKGEGGHDGG